MQSTGTKALRAIYGGNSRQAIARAIRAEIDGGESILAAEQRATMEMEHRRFSRHQAAQRAAATKRWMDAHSARVAAENVIREKYNMPQRLDDCALPPVGDLL